MAADCLSGLAAGTFLGAQEDELLRGNDRQYRQDEEYHTQSDGDVEEGFLHTPASGEDAACVCPGQTTQPCTFAL
jgi:hypothetical protein